MINRRCGDRLTRAKSNRISFKIMYVLLFVIVYFGPGFVRLECRRQEQTVEWSCEVFSHSIRLESHARDAMVV